MGTVETGSLYFNNVRVLNYGKWWETKKLTNVAADKLYFLLNETGLIVYA